MKFKKKILLAIPVLTVFLGFIFFNTNSPLSAQNKTLPEFTSNSADRWINTQPLKKSDLAGKIVLVEVWTSI